MLVKHRIVLDAKGAELFGFVVAEQKRWHEQSFVAEIIEKAQVGGQFEPFNLADQIRKRLFRKKLEAEAAVFAAPRNESLFFERGDMFGDRRFRSEPEMFGDLLVGRLIAAGLDKTGDILQNFL